MKGGRLLAVLGRQAQVCRDRDMVDHARYRHDLCVRTVARPFRGLPCHARGVPRRDRPEQDSRGPGHGAAHSVLQIREHHRTDLGRRAQGVSGQSHLRARQW